MGIMRGITAAGVALALLAGCSSRSDEPRLMNIAGSQRSPDEFAILPTRPLQAPPDFRALPEPTPGGTNLVDPDPRAQAVAALGGRPSAARAGGVPSADAALVGHAARHGGASPNIREELAAEDLEFRRSRQPRILERLFGTNTYNRAYEPQALDPHSELERWRQAGARTPAAPPPDAR